MHDTCDADPCDDCIDAAEDWHVQRHIEATRTLDRIWPLERPYPPLR